MTDSYNIPLPPVDPDSRRTDRPIRPDSVEWWTPPRDRGPGPPEPIAPGPGQQMIGRPNYLLHAGLFVLTCLSTGFGRGVFYSAGIMSILLAHEMGHYVMARRNRVPATLPYFIPMPFSIFGTMGAVIRMASLGADRRQLFDIGVAGPIAGLVLAIPACVIGLSLSDVVHTSAMQEGYFKLGSPILFQWLADLIKGPLSPEYDIRLHPLAFAGWAGMFVTALNLLPVGQLDGGHAAYALLGRRANILSAIVVLGFLGLAVFVSTEWLFMAALLLLFGFKHPPTANDDVPMDTKRRVIGAIMLVLFVLMFTPRPFSE